MSVSYQSDIRPLFRFKDIPSMKINGGFDLSSYGDLVKDADGISQRLSAKEMPCDGPWSDEYIAFFKQWIADGKLP